MALFKGRGYPGTGRMYGFAEFAQPIRISGELFSLLTSLVNSEPPNFC